MDDPSTILGELEDQVTCWICFEIFDEPVTLHCGHSFCRDCCIKLYKKNPLCAFCRREFGLPIPGTNQQLVNLAAQFQFKFDQQGGAPIGTVLDVEQDSVWFDLPDEVVVDVFQKLPPQDIARLSLVCHHFKNLSEDNWLWRQICRERFPFVQVSRYGNSWKRCFASRHKVQNAWEGGRPGDFKMTPLRAHQNYVSAFDYYRNNVVSGSADQTLQVWNVNKTKPLHTLRGHSNVIEAIKFNEMRIVSASQDRTARVWDTTTGVPTITLNHTGSVEAVQFNETSIVTGSADCTGKVWDVRSGQAQLVLRGHTLPVFSVDINDNRVISVSSDTTCIWDLKAGAVRNTIPTQSHTRFAQPVGTNEIVLAHTDRTLSIWDLNLGQRLHHFPQRHTIDPVTCMATDGESIILGSGQQLCVYDYKKRQHVVNLKDHQSTVHGCQIDGQRLVSCSADNTIKVWDLKQAKRLYSLLGGSLQQRANSPPHPQRPGCSGIKFDDGRIVGAFNSLLRVYSFTGEDAN